MIGAGAAGGLLLILLHCCPWPVVWGKMASRGWLPSVHHVSILQSELMDMEAQLEGMERAGFENNSVTLQRPAVDKANSLTDQIQEVRKSQPLVRGGAPKPPSKGSLHGTQGCKQEHILEIFSTTENVNILLRELATLQRGMLEGMMLFV